jgi:hypothetical protein
VSVDISKNNDIGYAPPFGFRMDVETKPGSHIWKTATLTYATQEAIQRTAAHDVILQAVRETPGITKNRLEQKVRSRVSVSPAALTQYRNDLVEWGLLRIEDGQNKQQHHHSTENLL